MKSNVALASVSVGTPSTRAGLYRRARTASTAASARIRGPYHADFSHFAVRADLEVQLDCAGDASILGRRGILRVAVRDRVAPAALSLLVWSISKKRRWAHFLGFARITGIVSTGVANVRGLVSAAFTVDFELTYAGRTGILRSNARALRFLDAAGVSRTVLRVTTVSSGNSILLVGEDRPISEFSLRVLPGAAAFVAGCAFRERIS